MGIRQTPIWGVQPPHPRTPPTWGPLDTGRNHHPVFPRPEKELEKRRDPNLLSPDSDCRQLPGSPRDGAHPEITPSWPRGHTRPLCTLTHTGVHTYVPGQAWTLYPSPAPEEVRKRGPRSRRRCAGPGTRPTEALAPPPRCHQKARRPTPGWAHGLPEVPPPVPSAGSSSPQGWHLPGPRTCHLHLRGHREIPCDRGCRQQVLCVLFCVVSASFEKKNTGKHNCL